MQNKATHILQINSSSRHQGSYSRQVVEELVAALKQQYDKTILKERDISKLPFLSELAVEAMFVPFAKQTEEQKASLLVSEELIAELAWSDIIVIGMPIYNFNIPAALKAYLDLIVRIDRTFVHTSNGSGGLVEGKKAYVVVTSSGTVFKSKVDFASTYIEFILSFIGIKDTVLIDATQIDEKGEQLVLSEAKRMILSLVNKASLKEDLVNCL